MMYSIWKKLNEESFELVEELDGDIEDLRARLFILRQSTDEYRAELKTEYGSSILED